MKKLTYYEMLKHPKWQKKRLEILERDEFRCSLCLDTDQTLHVHHEYYNNNLKLWEYPPHALTTLCSNCHREAHELNNRFNEVVSRCPEGGMVKSLLIGIMIGMQESAFGDSAFDIEDHPEALGAVLYSNWYNIEPNERRKLVAARRDGPNG